MSDLIDRQAAIDAHCELCEDKGFCGDICPDVEVFQLLPSAQPEVIRCKDCRYYQDNNSGYPHMNCKWDANETPDGDDFCSGAERRTDENNNE